MSKLINGIAASDGVAIAKAYLLVEPDLSFTNEKVTDTDAEIQKFRNALEASKIELTKIRNNAEKQLGPDKAAIFDAHLLVLDLSRVDSTNRRQNCERKSKCPRSA